jgi:hypothetical protein
MARTRALALAASALSLGAGCSDPLLFVQVDEPSLTVTQTLPPVPGAPAVAVSAFEIPPGGVEVSVGDLVVGSTSRGSRLTLNGARLALLAPAPGTTFAGVTAASLEVVPPAGSGLPQAAIATYDQARDGPAGATLALAGSAGVDLLPYLGAKTLRVVLGAAGTPPGPAGTSWTADLTLDLHLVAEVSYP